MSELAGLFTLGDPSFGWAVATALVCGGIAGLERQIRGKAIGIRTSMLICLSTQVFVRLGVSPDGAGTDPSAFLGKW